MTAVDFFQQFLREEFEAFLIHNTEPDNRLANEKTLALRERRPDMLSPMLTRSGRWRPERAAMVLKGADVRSLFAVIEHGEEVAVAYIGPIRPSDLRGTLDSRLIAEREPDGWRIVAYQPNCHACVRSDRGACGNCKGTGFAPTTGARRLLPAVTERHLLLQPTHETAQWCWEALVEDGGAELREVLGE